MDGGMTRLTVYFEGRVQGVGFRYRTREVARRFDVTGYVRNRPDGRVELVAEGSEPELDRFVSAVEQAMGGFIHGKTVHRSAASGAWDAFEIAY